MTNILEKIIAEKKITLDLIKKEKSLDNLEKNIKKQVFFNLQEKKVAHHLFGMKQLTF